MIKHLKNYLDNNKYLYEEFGNDDVALCYVNTKDEIAEFVKERLGHKNNIKYIPIGIRFLHIVSCPDSSTHKEDDFYKVEDIVESSKIQLESLKDFMLFLKNE